MHSASNSYHFLAVLCMIPRVGVADKMFTSHFGVHRCLSLNWWTHLLDICCISYVIICWKERFISILVWCLVSWCCRPRSVQGNYFKEKFSLLIQNLMISNIDKLKELCEIIHFHLACLNLLYYRRNLLELLPEIIILHILLHYYTNAKY